MAPFWIWAPLVALRTWTAGLPDAGDPMLECAMPLKPATLAAVWLAPIGGGWPLVLARPSRSPLSRVGHRVDVWLTGGFEETETTRGGALFAPTHCILDVGQRRHTQPGLGEVSPVVALELAPGTYLRLEANVAAAWVRPHPGTLRTAAGDAVGEVDFSVQADSAFSPLNDTGRTRFASDTVPYHAGRARRRAALPVGLLKIDVEGLERVTAGAAVSGAIARSCWWRSTGLPSNPPGTDHCGHPRVMVTNRSSTLTMRGQPYQRHRDALVLLLYSEPKEAMPSFCLRVPGVCVGWRWRPGPSGRGSRRSTVGAADAALGSHRRAFLRRGALSSPDATSACCARTAVNGIFMASFYLSVQRPPSGSNLAIASSTRQQERAGVLVPGSAITRSSSSTRRKVLCTEPWGRI